MKALSFSKERMPFFLSLIAVIVLGCLYYFAYLPKNELDINEWKFRTLRKIDKNFHSKIDGGHKQIETYLKNDILTNMSGQELEKLNDFLGKQRTANFPIGFIRPIGADIFKNGEEFGIWQGFMSRDKSKQRILMTKESEFNSSKKKLTLIGRRYINEKGGYELRLNYDIENFIKSILPLNVFDGYIVIGDDQVLFESFSSGMDVKRDSSLKPDGNLTGASIIDREFGGIKYKCFVQPVRVDGKSNLLVVGLLSQDHFFHAKTRLPPRLILFLITIFTLILVTFPILKLFQLVEEDQLSLSDALSVMIVTMFLMSIIFLIFIKYSGVCDNPTTPKKKVLAENIKSEYIKEITSNFEILHLLDKLGTAPAFKKDFITVVKNRKFTNQEDDLKKIYNLAKDIDLDRAYWMRSDGEEFRTWTSSKDYPLFKGNFKERPYFQGITNNMPYRLASRADSAFYTQPFVSWVSGKFLTNISIKSRLGDTTVASISFKLKSLRHAKLPPIYNFAVVSQEGNVLYHSDSTKNLNENLFEEFSASDELKYSISSGSEDAFNTQYYGNEYSVVVSPIGGGVPYHLVILEDLVFDEYRDVNVFGFTISMQLLIFLLVEIQILIVFFASAKPSIYKNKIFDTDWIGPRESSNLEYIISTGFNVFICISICFFPFQTFLSRIFMLLAGITAIPVFLNILFVQKFSNSDVPSSWYRKRAGGWGASVLLIINVVAFGTLDESRLRFVIFEITCIALPALIFLVIHKKLAPGNLAGSMIRKINLGGSYAAVLFSWMLVVMGLPILVFFRSSYDYDQHVVARFNHVRAAEASLHEATGQTNDPNRFFNRPMSDSLTDFIYRDGRWISSVSFLKEHTSLKHHDEPDRKENLRFISLIQFFHIYRSERMPGAISLNRSAAGNFKFNDLMERVASIDEPTVTRLKLSDRILSIRSSALNFHLPGFSSPLTISWWILFFLALAGLYFVFSRLIKKIFAIGVRTGISADFYHDELEKCLKTNHVYLVGYPGIGKFDYIEQLLDNDQLVGYSRIVFDFSQTIQPDGEVEKAVWDSQLDECYNGKYELIILRHFEHGFNNIKSIHFKLMLLENLLLRAANSRLLILSTISPDMMIDIVCKSEANNHDSQTVSRWHTVLGAFKMQLDQISESKTNRQCNRECKEDPLYESLVSDHHFYFTIWQSLSKEEKFIIYDLAEDGIMNTYDKYTLALLLRKGLIVKMDGRMKLFKPAFRGFVMVGLGGLEMGKLIEKINDNSHWNRIRMPLIMISLAILIFIVSSQHETSTKLITTLGALSAAIPTLINFLSTLGGVSGNKKAA